MVQKKQWLLTPFLLLALNMSAQQKKPTESINPFAYGKQVTAVEDNFENLFRNVPLLISDPDDITFLDYRFLGVVHNRKEAKKYLSQDYYSGERIVGFSSLQNGSGETYNVKITLSTIQASQASIDGLITALAKHIHEGYKAYQIRFTVNQRKQHYNVFVNPETNEVVAENNQFLLPRLTKVK